MDEYGLITLSLMSMVVAITGSILFWSFKLGISPTPTSPKVLSTLESVLPKTISGTIYELGSGFGSLLLALHKQYPNHDIIGYERSTVPCLISRCLILNQSGIIVKRQNFLKKKRINELSDAGLVVCYLYPKAMQQLAYCLQEQLPEGCVVISHTFRMPGWTPIKEVKSNDLYQTSVFVYKIAKLNQDDS